MFPLHESTQRWICRVVFTALCVAPTTSLLAYALWLKTPVHRNLQAADLSHATGTSISLDQLQYPLPATARLTNVVLKHAESGEELARVHELELHRRDGMLIVRAAQPQVKAHQLDELWRQISQHLMQESFPACNAVRLIAHDVTLSSDDGAAQTFALLEAEFNSLDGQRTFDLKYRLAETEAELSAVFRLVQMRDVTKLYWSTGGAKLSLAPWASQWPALQSLGEDCQFRGTVSLTRSDEGASGKLAGELTNVNLDRLVSRRFTHKLSGSAAIDVQSAEFEDDRLVRLDANVAAGPGVIGDALIESASQQWNLASDASSDEPLDRLNRYQALACDVSVADGQLLIQGACPEAAPHTLLVLADGSSWRTEGKNAHNPASLVRILSRDASADVPATESTRHLIRWLPLAREPRESENDSRPTAHLRGP